MIKARFFLLVLSVSVLWACEDKLFTSDIDCYSCYEAKFSKENLEVKFSADQWVREVYFWFYQGDVDNGTLIDEGLTNEQYLYFYVPVNENYAVKALYFTADSTEVVVVNGTNFKRRFVSDVCSRPCYYVPNYQIDVSVRNRRP